MRKVNTLKTIKTTKWKNRNYRKLMNKALIRTHRRNTMVRLEKHVKESAEQSQTTPNEYAEAQLQSAAKDIIYRTKNLAAFGTKTAWQQGRKAVRRYRMREKPEDLQESEPMPLEAESTLKRESKVVHPLQSTNKKRENLHNISSVPAGRRDSIECLQECVAELRPILYRQQTKVGTGCIVPINHRIKQKDQRRSAGKTIVPVAYVPMDKGERIQTTKRPDTSTKSLSDKERNACHGLIKKMMKQPFTQRRVKPAIRAAPTVEGAAPVAATMAERTAAFTLRFVIASLKTLLKVVSGCGGIVTLIAVVICMAGLTTASCFGIFFSGEDIGTGQTMSTAVRDINTEYANKIEEIKDSYSYDKLSISGDRAPWPDVLAIYAVRTTTDPSHSQEVATMDDHKKELLRETFWAMNEISYHTKKHTTTSTITEKDEEGNVTTRPISKTKITLLITIRHKTVDEMADIYQFNVEQRQLLAELLSEEYYGLWSSVLYGIGKGDGDIVCVALSQVGNIGGEPYWSWCGFPSRVEWCACFVSWCANECGYIDIEVIPKFINCVVGSRWFQDRGLWQERNYEPRCGDLIFFDWDDGAGQDGRPDHVGIVEKTENGRVYTIEGNSGDQCKQRQYSVGHYEIYGYATPAYENM